MSNMTMTAAQFRAELARLGQSQLAFARLSGISPRQVRRYAAGEAEIPRTVEVILQLLCAGKITAEDL